MDSICSFIRFRDNKILVLFAINDMTVALTIPLFVAYRYVGVMVSWVEKHLFQALLIFALHANSDIQSTRYHSERLSY